MTKHKKEKISEKDLILISNLHSAMQQERHRLIFLTVFLFVLFFVVFFAWAVHAPLDEITHGQGSVVPNSREQVIKSLEAGILKQMLVKEGDVVEQGQVLLTIDDTSSTAILREEQAKVGSLQAKKARLVAEVNNTKISFSKDIDAQFQKREKSLFTAHRKSLVEAIGGLRKSRSLLDREIKITDPMVKKGLVSEIDLLKLKRQRNEVNAQITEINNKYKTEASKELALVEAELAQAFEKTVVRADTVDRSQIKAPLRGIVKNIKLNTLGGVVRAGEDIMEIMPIEERLLVEAYVRPQDVAFIRPGLPAVVKISAYDYSVYGGLDGKVTLISPGTLKDSKRSELNLNPSEAFYRILVETEKNVLIDANGEELPIIPGMIATVDVKTGQKTVFQYIMKPILRSKLAMRER